ncbi:ribonuclease E inhibitor RraA/Dimethylmenaquinone methyltransferase [Coniella lustricola]|uniref:Ribonuclease E inhibitor RraA/Dimethylmenaquinone methyltransferase n=1 Tax=Coniella lustricola TaxID=2025994 RepID=A0A2T3A1U8_9PEZI|nr:ribonuclease E inhibitor RraA/Dimethylmenaquinone methyltransferase [Coniella lustricola]
MLQYPNKSPLNSIYTATRRMTLYRGHWPSSSTLASAFNHTHKLRPSHQHQHQQQATMSCSAAATSTDPLVEQLKQYTTCDVSNGLVKLKFRNGGFLSGLTLWSPERQAGDTRIVGPVYTVQYAPLSDPRPKLPTHYIDGVPAGAVVFVSCPQRVPNAVYGGLMTARARALGAVGSVIDGRFRDLHEHREMGFPIFGRDVGTAPPHELVKVVAVNVPVKLATDEQDMDVRPGDYVIGDLNGVVVVPKELAAEALPLIKASVEADDKIMVEVQNGMPFEEASKKFRG